MTRALILGGGGMLGHKLWETFRDRFETWVTVRSSSVLRYEGVFRSARLISQVDANQFDSVVEAFGRARPDVVINAVGVIKQRPEGQEPIPLLTINALFPHRLAALCRATGVRLIHVSTDCVFSGRRGMYLESDPTDAEDLYGKTKALGEPSGSGALTVRTSIIGRELSGSTGLTEWFLSQRGTVRGYTNARFSGFPTVVLAEILAEIVEKRKEMEGLFHLSADPISKHDLLVLLKEAFDSDVLIEPYEGVRVDRTLDSTRFRASTGFQPQPWPEMVRRMAEDATRYPAWRQQDAL